MKILIQFLNVYVKFTLSFKIVKIMRKFSFSLVRKKYNIAGMDLV